MSRRRGRGEGSIFQRKDGTWCGVLTTGYDANGKRRRRYVYGATKAEVLEAMVRLRTAVLDHTLGEPTKLRTSDYLARWLTTSKPALRESTFTLYDMVIRRHIVPRIGGLVLSRLTAAHLQSLLADLESSDASPALRQVVFRVLHRALKQAVQWGTIPKNPADAVIRPKVPRKEMQVLTPDQARRFLQAVKEDRLHALYAVLLGCGLRLGEALGLTWPDLDLAKGTLTVNRQLQEVRGRLSLIEPKTASARRIVNLPGFVVEALRAHEDQARREGTLLNDRLLVFTDTAGNPLRRSNIRRRSFEPLLRKAGIPRIRLHDLRHTAATLHLLNGTHPSVVQKMLGHSKVGITLDVYSHVLPSMGQEAAERMDALLNGQQQA